MMGIISALITGFVLKSWWPAVLALIPYIGLLIDRRASILGFAVYLITLPLFAPSASVYTTKGEIALVLLGSTTIFVLSDSLRGISLPRKTKDFIPLVLLPALAIENYTILLGFPALVVYSLHETHGRTAALYSALWFGVIFITFLVLRNRIPGTTAEAFIMSALGLTALIAGGINETEHWEVER